MGIKTSTDTATASAALKADPRRDAADYQAPAPVDLRFQLLFSALYHDLCEISLTRRNRVLTALNLLLGSGAAVAIGAQYPVVAQGMGITIAVIGAVQLVWDFSGTAHKHATLRGRYYDLLADLSRGEDHAEISARMTGLYGAEPPISQRFRRIAHNRAGESLYGKEFDRA